MAREFKVMCSNTFGTYTAGKHIADTAEQACDMARDAYRNSSLGRHMNDVGAFRFFTVNKFPHEEEE
jgi:hypothetical protein